MGIRESLARTQSAGGRSMDIQYHVADAASGARRPWPDLSAGRPGAAVHSEGPPQTGARGLVPAVSRLPPLLSQPAPALRCLRAIGGSAEVPPLKSRSRFSRLC